MKRILFVCTGNTCRSPMAKALFEKYLQENGWNNEFQVFSAGIYAGKNELASDEAVVVMRDYDIDLTQHRSTILTDQLVEESQLILTMTGQQAQLMRERFPQQAHVIYTFAAYAGDAFDIMDPFGRGIGMYREAARQLDELTRRLLDRWPII